MELGILGLAQSGRTTLFRALTGVESAGGPVRVGTARVPDPRLQRLEEVLKPKKAIPGEVKYLDVDLPPQGIAGVLPSLQRVDALVLVVRAFKNEAVPHPKGILDPHRDLADLSMELFFSDMGVMEKRLERIEAQLRGARPPERDNLLREQKLLKEVRGGLEKEAPVRDQGLTPEGARALEGFALFTAKPWLLVVNIGEEEVPRTGEIEREWGGRYPRLGVVALCARLEAELAQLAEAEAREFRASLGLQESARDRLLRLSYQVLGLISFFTVVSGEVRAWAIPKGTPAVKAAGKVHSDMERGFIRAEVIGVEDLARAGGLAQARKQGLLRQEGKTYAVQDGDVITILFSV